MIDNHNLHIEGKMNISNPLDVSWGHSDEKIVRKNESCEDVVLDFEKLTLSAENDENELESNKLIRLEECYTEEPAGTLNCNFCPGKYKREGNMKNHIETKHNMTAELICQCGQIFVETTRYLRHKKGCSNK